MIELFAECATQKLERDQRNDEPANQWPIHRSGYLNENTINSKPVHEQITYPNTRQRRRQKPPKDIPEDNLPVDDDRANVAQDQQGQYKTSRLHRVENHSEDQDGQDAKAGETALV